jgi:hypothetical protein
MAFERGAFFLLGIVIFPLAIMSILVVCKQQAHTHAQSLLHRITGSDAQSWEIDNKYYTARVPIRLHVLEESNPVDVGDSLAVIYAYTASVRPLHRPLPSLR